jgi:hypothetical protein
MPRRLLLALCPFLTLNPALADVPNLTSQTTATTGAAAQLVLAQRVFRQAQVTGDPILLLTAIRLARGVTTRPAPGWALMGESEPLPLQGPTHSGPPNPGSAESFAILQGLAVDDPDLQDLAYDLTAQVPQARKPVASIAAGGLGAGNQDEWRLPLSGSVPAEIALLGDGGGPLALTVTDDTGAAICTRPPSLDPALCRFTPARNGFFTVEVTNAGVEWNSYQLVGN